MEAKEELTDTAGTGSATDPVSRDRHAANEAMATIALKQGIYRIRLFNRDGRLVFSTLQADPGTQVPASGLGTPRRS